VTISPWVATINARGATIDPRGGPNNERGATLDARGATINRPVATEGSSASARLLRIDKKRPSPAPVAKPQT
jgi:hypothetical protein